MSKSVIRNPNNRTHKNLIRRTKSPVFTEKNLIGFFMIGKLVAQITFIWVIPMFATHTTPINIIQNNTPAATRDAVTTMRSA